MAQEKLYVSIGKEFYKRNNSDLLLTQQNLIHLQKSLYNLRNIRAQKKRNLLVLSSLLKHFQGIVERLDAKLPTPEHSEIQIKKEASLKKKTEKVTEKKQTIEEREFSDLDKELEYINKKLLELNS